MPDYAALIDLLKQPGIHAPEKMAARLGITIDDLSRQLAELQNGDAGIIEAVDGEFRLDSAVSLLDEQKLRDSLSQTALCRINRLDVLQSVNSTNSFLLEKQIAGGQANVCLTEDQSAGRGRHGNSWHSASHRNLMFSISWEFSHWPATITGLGMATSLIVAQRLNSNFELNASIKWPNDLLVEEDKIGGILVDAAGQSGGTCKVVIGIGLNIHQPEWPQSHTHDYPWQDLNTLGVQVDRNLLAAQLIEDLLVMLVQFERTGFAPMAADWNSLSSYQDRHVRVGDFKSHNSEIIEGRMRGVDDDGALLVRDDAGTIHRFTDSSISVRLLV